jgi:hypothetical protein
MAIFGTSAGLLDLIEQALMNLDCVIRHAEKACFSAFEPSP